MYTLDFWLYDSILENFWDIWLNKEYSDTNIFGILSSLMETSLWFLLYIRYIKDKEKKINVEELYNIYCIDVLNISKNYLDKTKQMIKELEKKFEWIMKLWIEIDDNTKFFKIWLNNRQGFIKWKEDIYKSISGEDVLWFKWFLKNITYYNKRYLMPK